MATVVLGIGGNVGDRISIQGQCIEVLNEQVGQVTRVSALYWNGSVDFDSKHLFANRCVVVETDLDPLELLAVTQQIEADFGRVKEKAGSSDRTLDIDIIAYGSTIEQNEALTIPHPRMHDRIFVLLPMLEVMPGWKHPRLNRSLQTLLSNLS